MKTGRIKSRLADIFESLGGALLSKADEIREGMADYSGGGGIVQAEAKELQDIDLSFLNAFPLSPGPEHKYVSDAAVTETGGEE